MKKIFLVAIAGIAFAACGDDDDKNHICQGGSWRDTVDGKECVQTDGDGGLIYLDAGSDGDVPDGGNTTADDKIAKTDNPAGGNTSAPLCTEPRVVKHPPTAEQVGWYRVRDCDMQVFCGWLPVSGLIQCLIPAGTTCYQVAFDTNGDGKEDEWGCDMNGLDSSLLVECGVAQPVASLKSDYGWNCYPQ